MKPEFLCRRSDDKVKRNTLLLGIAAALGGVLFFAWLNQRDFEKEIATQAEQQLWNIAVSEAQSIERYVTDIQEGLEILSSGYSVRQIILSEDRQKQELDERYLSSLNDSYKQIGKLADSLTILDSRGVVIAEIPSRKEIVGTDLSHTKDVAAVLANPAPDVSDLFAVSNAEAVSVLQPVFEGNKFTGLLRAVMMTQRIDNLLAHINRGKGGYALLIDTSTTSRGTIISSPGQKNTGKSVLPRAERSFGKEGGEEYQRAVEMILSGGQGSMVVPYLPMELAAHPGKVFIAFVPVRLGSDVWSLVIVRDYNMIARPIAKNLRDNLMTAGFIFIIFLIVGILSYRNQNKKAQLEISEAALNIINRQLHLELSQRKKLEHELRKSLKSKIDSERSEDDEPEA